MKILLITCICFVALAMEALAQGPSVSPAASASPAGPAAVSSPAAAASAAATAGAGTSDLADKIHKRIDAKLKHKRGVHFTIGDEDNADKSSDESASSGHDEIPKDLFPLVAVVLLIVFGAPVAVVAVIMYFGFSRNRMMHRTVRMMVEKGQPVPAVLLNPPPHERKRSDMRRGVVLMMIGIGLVVFLGAVNDWENGSWSIGIIPLLIGVGYLLVWKLEGRGAGAEAKADNPPPVP
jgi:hypothetical protein